MAGLFAHITCRNVFHRNICIGISKFLTYDDYAVSFRLFKQKGASKCSHLVLGTSKRTILEYTGFLHFDLYSFNYLFLKKKIPVVGEFHACIKCIMTNFLPPFPPLQFFSSFPQNQCCFCTHRYRIIFSVLGIFQTESDSPLLPGAINCQLFLSRGRTSEFRPPSW